MNLLQLNKQYDRLRTGAIHARCWVLFRWVLYFLLVVSLCENPV